MLADLMNNSSLMICIVKASAKPWSVVFFL